jgi:fumarylacetoacetate (FAA) hydrolase
MKFVSYLTDNGEERAGLFYRDKVLGIFGSDNIVDLASSGSTIGVELPSTMADVLNGEEKTMDLARQVDQAVKGGKIDKVIEYGSVRLLAPVPHPPSCRDAYAFRQHVATARRNRGVDMIPEFDQYPVFYFTNHNAIVGGGDLVVESDHLQKLDFELECAVVIGKRGRNIQAKDADRYVVGYTIMNDFSARLLQMEEMKLNLGPAKGKDFATAIGPWLVTPDEFQDRKIETPFGNKYNLRMTAVHNGKKISEGDFGSMDWTFGEIIERCSYGVDIFPGDVIGSGTVGTGCYLELNGTRTLEAKKAGKEYTPVWLQAGDTIELEIEYLGKLTNRIVKASEDRSILAKKKNVQTVG